MRFIKKRAGPAIAGILACLALAAAPASAADVTYSTTGVFGAGTSGASAVGSTLTSGGFTITFTGEPVSTIDPTTFGSSNIDLGLFTVTGTSAGSMATFTGATFTLTINQTDPGIGSGVTSATLQGQLVYNASNTLVLSFFPDPVIIVAGGFATSYDLADSTAINPPGQNLGLTDLRGVMTQRLVPTPAAAMGGLALFGAVGLRRRPASL